MKPRRSPALKLSSLSKREMILVALFLFAALAGVYYKFVFEPQWLKINKLKSDLMSQQQVLSQRKSQGWDDIQSLKEQSRQLREKINKSYARVANIKDEPGLLVYFYKLSTANNLLADTIRFSEMKEAGGKVYSTFYTSLDVIGLNRDIYRFIEGLEGYSRANRISEIKFEPLSSDTSKCSLTVEFYVLHEVKPDPLSYPFMAGELKRDHPYKIFDLYNKLNDIKMLLVPVLPGSAPVPIPAPTPKLETPSPPKAEAPRQLNIGGPMPTASNNEIMIVSKDGIIWSSITPRFAKGTVVPP